MKKDFWGESGVHFCCSKRSFVLDISEPASLQWYIHWEIPVRLCACLNDLLMSVSTHWLCGALTAHPSAATFSLFCGFNLPHLFDPDVLLDYFHTFLFCIIKKTLQGLHSINIC